LNLRFVTSSALAHASSLSLLRVCVSTCVRVWGTCAFVCECTYTKYTNLHTYAYALNIHMQIHIHTWIHTQYQRCAQKSESDPHIPLYTRTPSHHLLPLHKPHPLPQYCYQSRHLSVCVQVTEASIPLLKETVPSDMPAKLTVCVCVCLCMYACESVCVCVCVCVCLCVCETYADGQNKICIWTETTTLPR